MKFWNITKRKNEKQTDRITYFKSLTNIWSQKEKATLSYYFICIISIYIYENPHPL